MRSFIFAITLTLLLGGFTFASAQTDTVRVRINRDAMARKGRVNIRFVALVEDSRCPRDVQCIQAGNARIRVRVTRGGRSQVLVLDTDLRGNRPDVFAGHEFRLVSLTPEPASNIRINPNGYVATIEVKRR